MRLLKALTATIHAGVERGFRDFVATYTERPYRPTFLAAVRRAQHCTLHLADISADPDSDTMVAAHAFAWVSGGDDTTVIAEVDVCIDLPRKAGRPPHSADIFVHNGRVVEIQAHFRDSNGEPEVLRLALNSNRHV